MLTDSTRKCVINSEHARFGIRRSNTPTAVDTADPDTPLHRSPGPGFAHAVPRRP